MADKTTDELLSLTNDYVFRRVFGEENVDSLAVFLSAVFDLPPDELGHLIVDDPNLHKEKESGKSGELDIRVHKTSGEIINVEIQVNPEKAFRERIAYYNDRVFTGQLKEGDSYQKLNKAITVVITEFTLIPETPDCTNGFQWYNISNGIKLTDKQQINILELSKLPDTDDGTKLWSWLTLLTLRREDEMEALAGDNKAMKDVVVTLRRMSADEAERRLAEAREKEQRDRKAEIEYGIDEGFAKGLEQGLEQGLEEGLLTAARNLKEAGAEKALILKATGISEEEYTNL